MSPVFGKGKYITASSSGTATEIYTSPNAITWTKTATLSVNSTVGKLLFSGTDFYFFSESDSTAYKSADTVNWSAVGSMPTLHSSYNLFGCGIAYYNGTFVAGSYNLQTKKVDLYYSNNDCATWTQTNINYTGPSQQRTGVRGIVAVEDGFALMVSGSVSGGSDPYTSKFFYSTDGVSWSESSFSLVGGYQGLGMESNNKVACFVNTTSQGYESTDGNSWTTFPITPMTLATSRTGINRKFFMISSYDSGICTIYWYNLMDGSSGSSSTPMVSPTTSSYTYYYSLSNGTF